MRRDARKVSSWDFNRIIPCHGVSSNRVLFNQAFSEKKYIQDVIETDAKSAWDTVYRKYLG